MIGLLSKPSARCSVRTRCASSGPKKPAFNLSNVFPLLNGEVAKKRNATIKENLNKMISIGSNDLKECYDLAVELDLAHKDALNMKKDPKTPTNSTDESSVSNATSVDVEDENIFEQK